MASLPQAPNPWPTPTPDVAASSLPAPPSPLHNEGRSMKRRRRRSGSSGHEDFIRNSRRALADQAAIEKALQDCQTFSGNNVYSCYPGPNARIAQHEWTAFVWNSNRPEITQFNLVDIFLFRGDSRRQVLNFTGVNNPSGQAGIVTAQVDDRWFVPDGENFANKNISYPFYWVIIRSDKTLDGNEVAQPIFTAVQTNILDSVASAQSSASAASSSSAASASSEAAALSSSLSASTRVTTINGTPTTLTGTGAAFPSGSGNLQPPVSDNSFPRWAIAVIVVLGFFAIVAAGVMIFLIIRRIRRRNQAEIESNRNSMGSASPMMANAQQGSPLLGVATLPVPQRPASLRRNDSHGGIGPTSPSSVLHDGESGISGEGGPFSGADAAIMADAFRKMLRKPDFAGQPVVEGESPDTVADNDQGESQHILNRELAEEGRDLRSVSSSRGVRVESHTELGDTIHRS